MICWLLKKDTSMIPSNILKFIDSPSTYDMLWKNNQGFFDRQLFFGRDVSEMVVS
jgi:hypothetical protein